MVWIHFSSSQKMNFQWMFDQWNVFEDDLSYVNDPEEESLTSWWNCDILQLRNELSTSDQIDSPNTTKIDSSKASDWRKTACAFSSNKLGTKYRWKQQGNHWHEKIWFKFSRHWRNDIKSKCDHKIGKIHSSFSSIGYMDFK